MVSRRLMYALRDCGIDAQMLVAEKRHDSPYIHPAGSSSAIRRSFMAERLKVFLANGLNRQDLFKVDIASDGLPLYRHKLVRQADVICLNWVNQGLLSLKGLRDILKLGKPVIWTMHDMWCMTGICHHAGDCNRWLTNCGLCKFLGKNANPDDVSFSVWNNKSRVYNRYGNLHFVAVSSWLANLARRSGLMADASLDVIPNAFPIPADDKFCEVRNLRQSDGKFRIVMGAARLDDPVKGFPILVETTRILRERYPEEASRMELVTFGNFKNPTSAEGIAISHRHLGVVNGEENIRDIYLNADAVVSTSLYETLPGTLVEGQVYGCIPVSFNRGGQPDIVEHLNTGYLAEWNDNRALAAESIAQGLLWASRQNAGELRGRMLDSARRKFAASAVAQAYISLFNRALADI